MAGFHPGTVRAPLHVFTADGSRQGSEADLADPAGWLAHTANPGHRSAQVVAGGHEDLMLIDANLARIAGVLGGGVAVPAADGLKGLAT